MNPEEKKVVMSTEPVSPEVQRLGQSAVQHTADEMPPVVDSASEQTASSSGRSSPEHAQPRPHPENKTIKLPVQTSVLPALLIGLLILVLLLAVAAYAFLS